MSQGRGSGSGAEATRRLARSLSSCRLVPSPKEATDERKHRAGALGGALVRRLGVGGLYGPSQCVRVGRVGGNRLRLRGWWRRTRPPKGLVGGALRRRVGAPPGRGAC